MKPALNSALTAIRRAAAWYVMRSLEITLAGKVEAWPHIDDPLTRAQMDLSIRQLSKDLCRARSHYSTFLPPGRRIVWDMA